MKICYIFSNIHLGKTTGQSGLALSLVEKAQELDHEVYIISNYENQQNNLDTSRAKKFLIKGPSTFKTYLLNSYRIISYLRKTKPDIIHIQGHLLIPFVYFLNKLVGNKIICTLPERIDYLNKMFRYLIISSIEKIGLCFVLSYWNKESLVQLGASEDRILATHIGLRDSFLIKRRKKQKYEYDIFYYGDASRERGFDALHDLVKRLPNLKFKLLIRWKKDEKERLKKLQKLRNVSIDYSSLGDSELKRLILKSKLVILPYRWMGVQPPISLLETMALGKCVLTSALPGSKELLEDNKNAIIIDHNGSIKKIVKKIEVLLKTPSMIERIGKNANETILKHYSSSEYSKIFIAYEMIVNNFYEWRMFGNIGGRFISVKETETLLDLLQPADKENILDVGTGSGRFARAIVKNSKAKVVGIDPDKKILEEGGKLRQIFLSKEESKRYKCLFGDGQNIEFGDGTFDKAFSIRTLKYYSDPYKGISELCRILKKRGVLVLEITSSKSWEAMINPVLSKMSRKRKNLHFWEKNMTHFNPARIKEYLLKKGMIIIDEEPLHKIPPLFYSKLKSQQINYLLDMFDKIFFKITPKYFFSKSIVLKCKKS